MRTKEGGVIKLGMDGFFMGHGKMKLLKNMIIKVIVIPLNKSGDREVVRA